MIPPTIIMCVGRSGSSMLTSIFGAHGLWIGRSTRKAHYQVFENEDIKSCLRVLVEPRKNPEGFRVLLPHVTRDQVRAELAEIVPHDQPWVFKQGIDWWPVWFKLYDGMKFVFVQRRPEAVAKSQAEKTGRPYRRNLEVVRMYYAIMDDLAERRGIPIVRTDEVVHGNYTTLETAMQHCGIDFDQEAARKMIDRKKWKH